MVVSIYLSNFFFPKTLSSSPKANVSSPENAKSLPTENGKPSSRKNAKNLEISEPSSLFSPYKKTDVTNNSKTVLIRKTF